MWSDAQIKDHIRAARLLTRVKNEAFNYLARNPGVTEHQVQEFVFDRFKRLGLETDGKVQIVAFDAHAAIPHYYPQKKSARLKPGTLILLDIWARLNRKNAPFADITWMAYYGKKIPREIQRAFSVVKEARDSCIRFLKLRLKEGKVPAGKEVDHIARTIVDRTAYKGRFIHGTGHPLGFTNPHGRGSRINTRGRVPLRKNLGYTIEPGIYLKNKFGIRSEIDFFIDKKDKVILTTAIQKRIVKI